MKSLKKFLKKFFILNKINLIKFESLLKYFIPSKNTTIPNMPLKIKDIISIR